MVAKDSDSFFLFLCHSVYLKKEGEEREKENNVKEYIFLSMICYHDYSIKRGRDLGQREERERKCKKKREGEMREITKKRVSSDVINVNTCSHYLLELKFLPSSCSLSSVSLPLEEKVFCSIW